MPSNQLPEGTKQIKSTFIVTKKTNHSSNSLMSGSFFTSAKLFLSQPL
ncbi:MULTISPECIES: hypothetical protein [Priestia]|nr:MULTISPECIES: hypothetical protein [Priestia]MED5247204.1 hypothetical protein [Priestia sp. LL-8]